METEDDYYHKFASDEWHQLLEIKKQRGLDGINIASLNQEQYLEYRKFMDRTLNEYAILMNARDRKITLFEALRNILYLKAKQEAFDKGYNSTLV